jgi:hypothetical protein
VTITVLPVNDPPVAVDDTAFTLEDRAVEIDVTQNDSPGPVDEISQTLAVVAILDNGPPNGSATIHPSEPSTVIYTPTLGFFGIDNFSYEVQDSGGLTATAVVTVNVYEAAGHITGGGTILVYSYMTDRDSTPTVCRRNCDVNFGNDAQYPAGSNVPVGQTTISIKKSNFDYLAEVYYYLIIDGAVASYAGEGFLHTGEIAYFEAIHIDADLSDEYDSDLFGFKLWKNPDGTGVIVNTAAPNVPNIDRLDVELDVSGALPVFGGQVTIH